MSLDKIRTAISTLNGAGIPAQRSFAADLQPEIQGVVAAVGLHKVTADATVLSVQLFCPPELGGAACEDAAVEAAQALAALGAECTQERCQWSAGAGLFSVQVLAAWKLAEPEPAPAEPETLACSITIDGVAQPYVTGFSAVQTAQMRPVKALETGIAELRREAVYWTLTLEELLPREIMPEEPKTFDFILRVQRTAGTEIYRFCCWEKVSRKDTPQGVRQVRIARSYAERSVE